MNGMQFGLRPLAVPQSGGRRMQVALAAALACMAGGAHSVELVADDDWQVRWDNTLTYNLGVRAQNADSRISTNVSYDESDNKFAQRGDIVTNMVSVISEFDATYQGRHGLRISASAWKDFAYDDQVAYAPGTFNGTVPYSALTSYTGNTYSDYTKRWYRQGAQLLDAFVYTSADFSGHRASLKVGRQTQYWGNSVFFPFHSISYGQANIDVGKSLANPGAEAKELFLPRGQVYGQVQLTPELALSGQYFFEWNRNRMPAGGTYLGIADFLFVGPDRGLLGPALVNRGQDFEPKDAGNHGLSLRWSPESMPSTTFGAYYRYFDETQPWAPMIGVVGGATNYHLSYATGVRLLGLSLDRQIGDVSAGFEVSYRRGTALNSNTGPLASDLTGREGARGNTLHMLANAQIGLTPNALYQTGIAVVEVAYSRLLDVTKNEALFKGANTAACGSKWVGCSTRDVVNLSALFSPQWLQVFPGIDFSAPVSATVGLLGNGATLSSGNQGTVSYSVGLTTTVRNQTTVGLSYKGYYSRVREGTAPYYAGGPEHYIAGNGTYQLNDRGWVALTVKSTF